MAETRCYMIVLADITDRPRFIEGYAKVVPALVARYGGKYLLRGAGGTFLEGDWERASALVSEWPDRAAAERFWNSTEYTAAKKLREGTGRFQVLLIDAPAIGADA
jgi:uncharacterized protein (DUF1330 family)